MHTKVFVSGGSGPKHTCLQGYMDLPHVECMWADSGISQKGLRNGNPPLPLGSTAQVVPKMTCSGRLVKQEQWERWWANRKLVSGSQHQRRFCGDPKVSPPETFGDCICKILQSAAFLTVHNAFFNTLTMGTENSKWSLELNGKGGQRKREKRLCHSKYWVNKNTCSYNLTVRSLI